MIRGRVRRGGLAGEASDGDSNYIFDNPEVLHSSPAINYSKFVNFLRIYSPIHSSVDVCLESVYIARKELYILYITLFGYGVIY